jgi:hypothetical protein
MLPKKGIFNNSNITVGHGCGGRVTAAFDAISKDGCEGVQGKRLFV